MTAPSADLIIHSAVIWDGDRLLPETAVAVADGRVVALGGEELRERFSAARSIDARGGLLTPGFVDAHVHAAFGGLESIRCNLLGLTTADDMYAAIADYAKAHPEAPWILGAGWAMPAFPGGTPLAADLDRIVPDRPVFLLNCDHHGAWVNTRALEIAGITADTPDPHDGRIERDADGNPTGTLHEGAAELVAAHLPETTQEERDAGLLAAQDTLFSYGVVGWQEAILGSYGGLDDFSETYARLIDSGKLRARATGALWVSRGFDGMTIPEFVDSLIQRRKRWEREGFTLDTAKIMVDGVAENQTALLGEPYLDGCRCGTRRGLAYFTREQLLEVTPLLNRAGFNAHFHAIGDRAVRYALDALEAVPESLRVTRRNHIAHIQLVDPADVPRFAACGATANMQMLWAAASEQNMALTAPFLGPERTEWHYPFQALAAHGTALACGSDWSVSSPDPWQAIHVGVTRREPGDTVSPPLVPAQALTLEQSVRAYTRGSAELLGVPGGRIAVGEIADFALANRNPFAGAEELLHTTRNVLTVIGGRVVFDRSVTL